MKPVRSRYVVVFLVFALMFAMIFSRMYELQITSYADYKATAESQTTKTLSLVGKRGTIYDSNMIPIAYDQLTYNVQFYRDPSAATEADRAAYTQSIIDVIKLIEDNGKSTIDGFWLEQDEEGKWRFNTGTTNASVEARRIKQWRDNFYLPADQPVEELFDTLCEKYVIPDTLSIAEKLKVLSVWQESRMYNYLSRPVTIAYNVDFSTVSLIEARSMDLLGISIAESSQRVYPKGSLAAHTIGYIGKITGDEALKTYAEKGYAYDSLVGATGIEASMEDQLTPNIATRQGKRVVEINNRGKIIRELSYQAPVDGNDIYLTIDTKLQAVAEQALAKNIQKIEADQKVLALESRWLSNNREELMKYEAAGREIQFAQTGAVIAMDPKTGHILAMASYPTFDLSLFTSGVDPVSFQELVSDPRNPMFNRAISARDTPGSIFKLVTALGGLMEGAINLDTIINDAGPYTFTGDTSNYPSCWVSPGKRYIHQQNQTLSKAISNSCNYFFYTVGQAMGSEAITRWGAQLGLTSRTGIELPNEATSFVGNQLMLYDPNRAIVDQYTNKPEFSAYMIKKRLIEIGEDRGIKYDEDRLDRVTKMIIDISVPDGKDKSTWAGRIHEILINEMNIPVEYIRTNYLGNLFQSYIQDLRWTASETVMAAIGQSITQVTPIGVARYLSAIINGGTVYNAQIIDKIVSPTGTVIIDKEPVVSNQITGEYLDEYLAAIQLGMQNVTSIENDGTAGAAFTDVREKYKIAGKTGTSQRTKLDLENNSWFITYAPYDDPQIVVVVYIQNGYAGLRAADTVKEIIKYYLDNKDIVERTTLSQPNTLGD